jgi:hypothetical protein
MSFCLPCVILLNFILLSPSMPSVILLKVTAPSYLTPVLVVLNSPSPVVIQVLVFVPVAFDELVVVELQLRALPLTLDILHHLVAMC